MTNKLCRIFLEARWRDDVFKMPWGKREKTSREYEIDEGFLG